MRTEIFPLASADIIPQRVAGDLSCCSLRQVVDHTNFDRALVGGKSFPTEAGKRPQVDRRAGLWGNEGNDRFAAIGIRRAYDRSLAHVGEGIEHVLNLARPDFEARG